jgi:DNA-binding transcriptional LysR family regulator
MDKLKAMAIFVEIADQGSMSAAARNLGVVNSVVSKNLNDLEQWLGRKLIFRSTRNLKLTQDGMTYLEQCQNILAEVALLEARTQSQDRIVSGHLKLTAPVYLGERLLAPIVATFADAYPNVTLELVLSDEFKDMVDEGFDIAFRVSQMPDSSYISRRLGRVRIVTVAAPRYLDSAPAISTPKDLRAHRCILENSSSQKKLWRFKSRSAAQANVQVGGPISAGTGQLVKALCLEGLGIAQLPHFIVEDELQRGLLIEQLSEYALDNFYTHMLYHQHSTGQSAIRATVDHFVSWLSDGNKG